VQTNLDTNLESGSNSNMILVAIDGLFVLFGKRRVVIFYLIFPGALRSLASMTLPEQNSKPFWWFGV